MSAAVVEAQDLQLGREPGAASYPAGAVEYVRPHNLPGNLFNEYHWGGYLIYQLHPNIGCSSMADPTCTETSSSSDTSM